MDFEEVYRKFLDGKATDEEVLFVAAEIRRAKEIDNILNLPTEKPIFEEATEEVVLKARKSFNKKTLIRTIIIILSSLAVIAAIVCGILFIPSTAAARRHDRYSREECVEFAEQRAREFLDADENTTFVVHDVDKRLYLGDGLTKAVYFYEVELRSDRCEIELHVNAKSGFAEVIDIDDL